MKQTNRITTNFGTRKCKSIIFPEHATTPAKKLLPTRNQVIAIMIHMAKSVVSESLHKISSRKECHQGGKLQILQQAPSKTV